MTDDLPTNSTRENKQFVNPQIALLRGEKNNESCMKVYCEWREHAGWQQHLVSQRILAGMDLLRADVGHSRCVYFRCIRNNYGREIISCCRSYYVVQVFIGVEGFTC